MDKWLYPRKLTTYNHSSMSELQDILFELPTRLWHGWAITSEQNMNACVLRIPPPPHDYPFYWVILDPKSKEYKVKVTNLKNLPNFQFFNVKKTLHATHLLNLLDKMCKYEINLTSIVEDTERTPLCPKTNRRTDGRTDKVKPVYPLFSTSLKRGV